MLARSKETLFICSYYRYNFLGQVLVNTEKEFSFYIAVIISVDNPDYKALP